MSEAFALKVQPRDGRGSRKASKLRKQGLLPAVIYGHKEEVVSVAVSYEEFDRAIRVHHARVFTVQVNGKPETVLIRELQWDHLGKEMVHVDLWRVSKDERVKVVIPVKLKNIPKSMGGGVLDQPLHQLHIECSPTSIPDDITIDITNLTLGNPIHIRELNLPEGVKVLESPEMVVVQIKLAGLEPTAVGEPGAAEPEVLTAKKPKDEDE